ncbi:retron Ec67 family RNA-directed DNA polymerase/endonuclease [Vibrio brasiliensis]
MSQLQQLKNCKSLSDFALLLGYNAKGLSYILYKIDDSVKYTSFQVDKKSGGKRTISKPCLKLKTLQRKLANLLYDCIEEKKPNGERLTDFKGSDKTLPKRKRAAKSISHGYEKGLSIATNAERHIKKRYVYNIDLESFFPSFNFGRVRGFFIKNKQFKLHPKVATIIAQIACHQNQLPQGSPCSPVISNLICKNLDYYLLSIAKENGCVYTRYVDDLTFSTNKKKFPVAIAENRLKFFGKQSWSLGKEVEEAILKAGFKVNRKKCRMQTSYSRQEVTGLTVNRKVNTSSAYYRNVRAMCHSVFKHGYYTLPQQKESPKKQGWISKLASIFGLKIGVDEPKDIVQLEKRTSLESLQGKLAHIYNIKSYRNKFSRRGYRPTKHDGIRTNNSKNPFPPLDRSETYTDDNHIVALDGIKNLYGKFLFFKHFYANQKPTIICEGKTDNIYLKCALESLAAKYPRLSKNNDGSFQVHFFNRTETSSEMLKLVEGSPGLVYLVEIYKRFTKLFNSKGQEYPVIIVVDNDTAGRGVINKADKIRQENRNAKNIKKVRRDDYFFENLYIVKVPSTTGDKEIEDLFNPTLLNTKLNGKTFHRNNTGLDPNKHYGKAHFSEYVVTPNKGSIDFSGFEPLLDIINDIINNFNPNDLD